MKKSLAVAVSLASGYIALSYEIVWYRALSIAMGGRAQAFGVMLAAYLCGIAAGALLARVACREAVSRSRGLLWLGVGMLAANALGFAFVPLFARLITLSHAWLPATLLLSGAAAGLGVIFPLVAELAVDPTGAVGRDVSHLYVANIAGSTAGTIVTGLVALDHLTLGSLTLVLALLGLSGACAFFLGARRARRSLRYGLAAVTAVVAMALVVLSRPVFANVHERLVFTHRYEPAMRFTHIVENRHGVIAVTDAGIVFGSGVYDGTFNTDLRHDEKNMIRRAYAIALFHPEPKRVLMIGLSTGSWAEVIASHPSVEHVTIVEINPGYLQLLPMYPEVSALTSDPRVQITIDDGRRWLVRHPAERFDLIVANTTFNWRANATSLLSVEFLDLVRGHLNPGGVYYYNTTGEPRVQRTGSFRFPYAWRLGNMLAVSDSPLRPDPARLRRVLGEYRMRDGSESAIDPAVIDGTIQTIVGDLEPRDSLLARTTGAMVITDDNMGTEWTLARRLWTY